MGLLAALVAVLVSTSRADSPRSGPEQAGGAAQPFTLPDVRLSDAKVTFSGRPERPTVVNFFGAWCVPCREELPLLAAEAKARPGVDFVGVDVRDIRSDAVRLLDETGVTFLAGFDARSEVARAYGVVGMPATVFIKPGGRILVTHQGPISRGQLREQLDRLEAA